SRAVTGWRICAPTGANGISRARYPVQSGAAAQIGDRKNGENLNRWPVWTAPGKECSERDRPGGAEDEKRQGRPGPKGHAAPARATAETPEEPASWRTQDLRRTSCGP